MKKTIKQILSALLVAIMLVGAIPISASAAYENTYTNTGNQRDDIIGVAKTQLGYTEGANNATKYGTWYGLPNQPWCAMFISWCARQAGISKDILQNSAVAAPDAKYFNIPYYDGSSYTPQKGDLFFTKSWSHVGLVYYVDGSYFYTIEGNSNTTGSSEGTSVVTNRRKISNFYFGVPKYNSGAPTYAKLSIDAKSLYVGQTITFTCDSDTADYYNIGIDRNGSRILLKKVGHLFYYKCDEPGSYTAYVSAVNSNGYIDSNKVSWNVYVGASVSAKMKVMCSSKAVRSNFYDNSDVITNITRNDIVKVIGYVYNSYGNLWYKINVNGKIGYTYWNYLEVVEADCIMPSNYISTKMTVTCSSKSVRTTPYGDSDTTRDVNKNDVLSIVGYVYNRYGNLWYAIGPDEYVYFSYLKENENNKAKSNYKYETLIVNKDTSCKKDPYAASDTTKSVKKGEKMIVVGYLINKYNNKWYLTNGGSYIYHEYLSPESYVVSYNLNGGTGSIASQTKTHGTNLTLTTTKPTGKSFTVTYNANGGTVSASNKTVSQTFTNWNTAANGSGTAYNAGTTYSANASVTLYAQYANPSIGSLPTPTRSGYAFDGWYTAANGGTKITDSTKVTANTTVYAHWIANTYTVSYNVNGGTGSIASQTKTYDTNLTLTTTKPTGKSFTVTYNANGGTVSTSSKTVSQTFTSWNTAANGSGTAYNAGATYSANASVTLYAQYANPSIGSLPTPTRSGYSFDGWYTAANGGTKITDSTKVTANTTVYAHWTKNAETKAVVKDIKIEHNATVNYKSTYMLSPEITADDGAMYTVEYSSSNTNIATVDKDGKIYGAKKGNATITCTVTDSYGNVVTDKCNVNVDYSGLQWFIIIVLFGWIWYI